MAHPVRSRAVVLVGGEASTHPRLRRLGWRRVRFAGRATARETLVNSSLQLVLTGVYAQPLRDPLRSRGRSAASDRSPRRRSEFASFG